MKQFDQCGISYHCGWLYRKRKASFLLLLLLLLVASGQVIAQVGIAPTDLPPTGFGIDGDGSPNVGQTNTSPPVNYSGTADWWKTTGSENYLLEFVTGSGVLLNQLHPEYATHTRTDEDPYGGVDQTTFTNSTKVNDPYGTTFTFGPGRVPNKNEINRSTVHFSFADNLPHTGQHGDLWCVFSADRQVNNGEAYIDFEFLQAPLYPIYNPALPGTGYFKSDGLQGTRTEGDILITIMFTNGGNVPTPVVQRWQQEAGVWTYVTQPLSFYQGKILMTSNQTSITPPWQPYGNNSYLPNQFAEGAINLSAIMGFSSTGCGYISTVFCRTKTSQSATAELKDFPGMPYQVKMGVNPVLASCPGSVSLAACTSDENINTAYTNWRNSFTYVQGTGVAPITSNIASLPVSPNLSTLRCGGTINFEYIVNDYCNHPDTCESSFSVGTPSTVIINKPSNSSQSACYYADQAAVNAAFTTWLTGFTVSGGCAPSGDYGTPVAPDWCTGGTTTVTYSVTDECFTGSEQATFTVTAPPSVVIHKPDTYSHSACEFADQAAINSAFTTWLQGFYVTGGCAPSGNYGTPVAPLLCTGGTTTVIYNVTDKCYTGSESQTFTITSSPAVEVNKPLDFTESACLYTDQASLNTAFTNWLTGFSVSGGCAPSGNYGSPSAPVLCTGGTVEVTYTVTDKCFNGSVTAYFTINAPSQVNVTEVADRDISACLLEDQDAADFAFYDWLDDFMVSGGCDPQFTDGSPQPPNYCGGSIEVTWTVTDHCYTTSYYHATFTITQPDPVQVTEVADVTIDACTFANQAAADEAFLEWFDDFMVSGGCEPQVNIGVRSIAPPAPNFCGGSTEVTWTVTDHCITPQEYTATYTILPADDLSIFAPEHVTMPACQTMEYYYGAYEDWYDGFSYEGGCRVTTNIEDLEINPSSILCGGTITFEYVVTNQCGSTLNGTSSFTIDPTDPLVVPEVQPVIIDACTSETEIQTQFATWMNSFGYTGGCNVEEHVNLYGNTTYMHCGAYISVDYSAEGSCGGYDETSSFFMVQTPQLLQATGSHYFAVNACSSFEAIQSAYNSFIDNFGYTGGCNVTEHVDPLTELTESIKCGGTIEIHYSVTDECGQSDGFVAYFVVENAPSMEIFCGNESINIPACSSFLYIEDQYNAWKSGFHFSGGCNATDNIDDFPELPANAACAGANLEFTYTVTSSCGTAECTTSTFTVAAPTALAIHVPQPMDIEACLFTEIYYNNYNSWYNSFWNEGGCDVTTNIDELEVSPESILCGGSIEFTYIITDECGNSRSEYSSFTIEEPLEFVVLPVPPVTLEPCNDQFSIDRQYQSWIESFGYSGGCDATDHLDITGEITEIYCGGTVTASYTASDICGGSHTITSSFTVLPEDVLVAHAPADEHFNGCTPHNILEMAYETWSNGFRYEGGCEVRQMLMIPPLDEYVCGGTIHVAYSVEDGCQTSSASSNFVIGFPEDLEVYVPDPITVPACSTSEEIQAAYYEWIGGFGHTGGCNAEDRIMPDYEPTSLICGGSMLVGIEATDDCHQSAYDNAIFSVAYPDEIIATAPVDPQLPACISSEDALAAFNAWKAGFTFSGGCDAEGGEVFTYPSLSEIMCGGTIEGYYDVWDGCNNYDFASSTFSIGYPTLIEATGPGDISLDACISYEDALAQYNEWIDGFSYTGGCNATEQIFTYISLEEIMCGGSISAIYYVSDLCGNFNYAVSTFSIEYPTPIVATGPGDISLDACISYDDALLSYTNWLNGFSYTGGCNPDVIQLVDGTLSSIMCGGTITASYYVLGDCNGYDDVTAYFTIEDTPMLTAYGPEEYTVSACSSLSDIETAYGIWLSQFGYSGGCSVTESSAPELPSGIECGGTVTYNYYVEDECYQSSNYVSNFYVGYPTEIVLNCPIPVDIDACTSQSDIQTAYNAWKDNFWYTGGCGASDNIGAISPLPSDASCNGADISFTYTVTSNCENPQSCTSYFHVAPAPELIVHCSNDVSLAACTSALTIQNEYDSWVSGFYFSGGCNANDNIDELPALPTTNWQCGISLEFTYTVTSDCEGPYPCTRTFIVLPDDIPPTFVNLPTGGDLGCDPTTLPSCDLTVVAIDLCGEATVQCYPGDVIIDGDNRSQTFTYVATDACGNQDSDDVTYTWTTSCGDNNCSLTQGFYGNANGTYCGTTLTATELINSLIGTTGFRLGGNALYIDVWPGDANCVILRLPGGGTPKKILQSHNICDNNFPATMVNKDGTFKNNLIAQTLTMELNVRLTTTVGTELEDLVLESSSFMTRASSDCDDPNAYPILGTEQYYTIPASIITALGSNGTVGDLLLLANRALNGETTNMPPLIDISNALVALNSGLDNCRFIYFLAPPVTSPSGGSGSNTTFNTSTNMFGTDEATMTVVPNPFSESTEIRYNLTTDSRISLEVYNLYGTKVATLFEGEAKAGFDYTYRFDPVGNNSEQVFLVVLRTNFGTVTKRIINTY